MTGRPPAYGPVRRALGKVMDWAMGKEVVGKDAMGNVYFRWHEGYGDSRTERREVQWSAEHMFYDPKDIPAEWRMWLRKLREEPPSDEELQQNAAKTAAYKARVAAVEEAERLRRLRQQTVGTSDQHAGAQPDISRFLQQMGSGKAAGPAAGAGGSGPSGAQQQQQPPGGTAEGGARGENFKPDTWRPGS